MLIKKIKNELIISIKFLCSKTFIKIVDMIIYSGSNSIIDI